MSNTERWGGLRLEPYDPDADDADNDGIVQEQTPWERPKGTTLVDSANRPIPKGTNAVARDPRMRVMRDGKEVKYTPTYGGQPTGRAAGRAGKPTATPLARSGYPSLKERGLRSLQDMNGTLKDRVGTPDVTPQPVPEVVSAPEPIDAFRLARRFRDPFDANPRRRKDAEMRSEPDAKPTEVTPERLAELDELDERLRTLTESLGDDSPSTPVSAVRRSSDPNETRFAPTSEGQQVLDDVKKVGAELLQEVRRTTPPEMLERQQQLVSAREAHQGELQSMGDMPSQMMFKMRDVLGEIRFDPQYEALLPQVEDRDPAELVWGSSDPNRPITSELLTAVMEIGDKYFPGFSDDFRRMYEWADEYQRLNSEGDQLRDDMVPVYLAAVRKYRSLGGSDVPIISAPNPEGTPEEEQQAVEYVQRAMDSLPTEWLAPHAEKGILVGHTVRGYFKPGSADRPSEIKLGAFDDSGYPTAVHELGHAAETALPELKVLEHLFMWSRVTDDESQLEYLPGETVYGDEFSNIYIGRTYRDRGGMGVGGSTESSFEVLSEGLRMTIGGGGQGDGALTATDEDHIMLTLGALAVVGRTRAVTTAARSDDRRSSVTSDDAAPSERFASPLTDAPSAERAPLPADPSQRGGVVTRARTGEEMEARADRVKELFAEGGGAWDVDSASPETLENLGFSGDDNAITRSAASHMARTFSEQGIAEMRDELERLKRRDNPADRTQAELLEKTIEFAESRSPEELAEFIGGRIREGLADPDTRVVMAVPSLKLSTILREGVIRSRHEQGIDSRAGKVNTTQRRRIERKAGLAEDADTDARPVSAYIQWGDRRRAAAKHWTDQLVRQRQASDPGYSADDVRIEEERVFQSSMGAAAEPYGDVQIIFRPGVQQRTKWGVGDSGNNEFAAVPMDNPTDKQVARAVSSGKGAAGRNALSALVHGNGTELLGHGEGAVIEEGTDRYGGTTGGLYSGYEEAMIFGGADLGDIEKIVISSTQIDRLFYSPNYPDSLLDGVDPLPERKPGDSDILHDLRVFQALGYSADTIDDELLSALEKLPADEQERILDPIKKRSRNLKAFEAEARFKKHLAEKNPDIQVVVSGRARVPFKKSTADQFGTNDPMVVIPGLNSKDLRGIRASLGLSDEVASGTPDTESTPVPLDGPDVPTPQSADEARTYVQQKNESIKDALQEAGVNLRQRSLSMAERTARVPGTAYNPAQGDKPIEQQWEEVLPIFTRYLENQVADWEQRLIDNDSVWDEKFKRTARLTLERQKRALARLADSSPEELRQQVLDIVRTGLTDPDTRIAVQMREGALDGLLTGKRWKTTHTVGTEGKGATPGHLRKEYEQTLGYAIDSPDELRPASGYILFGSRRRAVAERRAAIEGRPSPTADIARAEAGQAHSYGDIQVVLRREVGERTLFANGDSFDFTTETAPVNDPTDDEILAALIGHMGGRDKLFNGPYGSQSITSQLETIFSWLDSGDLSNGNMAEPDWSSDGAGVYTEALIPGGFDVAEIEEITVPARVWDATRSHGNNNRSGEFGRLAFLVQSGVLGDVIDADFVERLRQSHQNDSATLGSMLRSLYINDLTLLITRLQHQQEMRDRLSALNPTMTIKFGEADDAGVSAGNLSLLDYLVSPIKDGVERSREQREAIALQGLIDRLATLREQLPEVLPPKTTSPSSSIG